MPVEESSTAIEVARAHVDAWSRHDWDAARERLAEDVHVVAMTTQPFMKDTDLVGVEDYMRGLEEFAGAVVPGSAVFGTMVGDASNALLTVTVRARFGPGGEEVTLPAARLYLLDERQRIVSERVVFFTA